jgi:hypothetical protein
MAGEASVTLPWAFTWTRTGRIFEGNSFNEPVPAANALPAIAARAVPNAMQ